MHLKKLGLYSGLREVILGSYAIQVIQFIIDVLLRTILALLIKLIQIQNILYHIVSLRGSEGESFESICDLIG